MKYNKQFIKERDEALLSLDKEKIIAFYEKWGVPYSKSDKVFWGTVYKCIYHIQSATYKQRVDAKIWLINNGFDFRIK